MSIEEDFHSLCYNNHCWLKTQYKGTQILKYPTDLWIFSELIYKIKPKLIIETGTYHGASAMFLADQMLCEVSESYKFNYSVHTIDNVKYPEVISHPNVCYHSGSSTSKEFADEMKLIAEHTDGAVMVVLDSDHIKSHVLKELDALAPLVTKGSYLIVEDTNINGHPVLPTFGDGPWEALHEWLPNHLEFEIDKSCEKFGITFFPDGFLKRIN